MERYEQHSRIQIKRMEAEKKQDAVDVLLELSSGEPVPQQCFSNHCKDAIAKLQQECDDLREENRRLKTKLGTLDEQAFANDNEKVKALTGLPTFAKLQVVLYSVISCLPTQATLSPFQQLLLTLMRMKMNLSLALLSILFQILIAAASRTFRSTLDMLHAKLVPSFLFWPQREKSFGCQCP